MPNRIRNDQDIILFHIDLEFVKLHYWIYNTKSRGYLDNDGCEKPNPIFYNSLRNAIRVFKKHYICTSYTTHIKGLAYNIKGYKKAI